MKTTQLIYHCLARQNFCSESYFDSILDAIDTQYLHFVDYSDIYTPVEYGLAKSKESEGYLIAEKMIDGMKIPHYFVRQMSVSFKVDDFDQEVLDHLVSSFGQKASKYRLIEENYIEKEKIEGVDPSKEEVPAKETV